MGCELKLSRWIGAAVIIPILLFISSACHSKKDELPPLRYIAVGELFISGRSVDEIMALFGIRQTTVINHLVKCARQGFRLPGDELLRITALTDDQKQSVLEAFDQCGNEYLKPAFDYLNGTVQYDDLSILRLYHLNRQNES